MIIFDASSLFNLHNGALLSVSLKLPGMEMAFGPQVRQECRTIAGTLDQLVADGEAKLLSDDHVPFARFADLSTRYDLGSGETESLALADHLGSMICCDDIKARRMISQEIGTERLTGTIGLIRSAFVHGLLDERQARAAHLTMIARGGFLPELVLSLRKPAATAQSSQQK